MLAMMPLSPGGRQAKVKVAPSCWSGVPQNMAGPWGGGGVVAPGGTAYWLQAVPMHGRPRQAAEAKARTGQGPGADGTRRERATTTHAVVEAVQRAAQVAIRGREAVVVVLPELRSSGAGAGGDQWGGMVRRSSKGTWRGRGAVEPLPSTTVPFSGWLVVVSMAALTSPSPPPQKKVPHASCVHARAFQQQRPVRSHAWAPPPRPTPSPMHTATPLPAAQCPFQCGAPPAPPGC